jgi:DNA-binding response OmpR family regulator
MAKSDPIADSMNPSAEDRTTHVVEAPAKVLIVDDDREIADSICYALQGQGMTVVVARDGNQGIALAEREQPQLVILDMMMPKRSGFLVLERLRRIWDEPVPVIMITANEGARHRAYAEMLGVSEYMHKPFAMDRLLATVRRLLAGPKA